MKKITHFNLLFIIFSLVVVTNKPVDFLNLLLENPLRAIDQSYKIAEQFKQTIKETDTQDKFKKLEQHFEKQSPIFYLSGFHMNGRNPSPLNRYKQQESRQIFEDRVVQALLNCSNKPIQYISFTCAGRFQESGGLFQDLIILAKMLSKKPDAHITIHLIDYEHYDYVQARNWLENTHEVFLDYKIDPFIALGQLKKKNVDIELGKLIIATAVSWELKFNQLIRYLHNTFPQAKLSLHIHDKVDSYFDYINKQNLAFPDIISTVGLEDDEMNAMYEATFKYVKLCVTALQHNPSCCNIWLDRTWGTDDKTELRTITLHEVDGSIKIRPENNGTQVPIFVCAEKIKTLN